MAQDSDNWYRCEIDRALLKSLSRRTNWHGLVEAGSEAEAKKLALVHTEGKDYIVQDGDVLHVLFNV